MGKKLGSATVFIVGDVQGLNKALGQAQTMTNRAVGNITASMTSIGTKMTAIGASLSVGIGMIGKLGMDAVESESLFSVSFGKMEDSARSWSKELSKSLGVNQYEARKSAGMLNAMLKSMGQTEDAALKMSTGLTQLSYDMASFYNLKPEVAFEKLRSGISGESEPLKQLGVLITETETKAYALANGIGTVTGGMDANARKVQLLHREYVLQSQAIMASKKSTDQKRLAVDKLNMKFQESVEKLGVQRVELSESDKVAARYGLIMERTALAQGDLARTLDSPTNQIRIMKERMAETATTIGIGLLPALGEILKIMQPLVNQFAAWVTQNPDTIKALMLSGAAFAAFNLTLGPVLIAGASFLTWGLNAFNMLKNLSIALAAVNGGGLLGLAKGLGLIVGAAGVGWMLGRWIDNISEKTWFGEMIDGWADSVVKLTDKLLALFGVLDSNAGKLNMANATVKSVSDSMGANASWNDVQNFAHGGVAGAASGMIVRGSGGKTSDTIPIMTSPGEMILPNIGVKPKPGLVDAAIGRLAGLVSATRGGDSGGRMGTFAPTYNQTFTTHGDFTPQLCARIVSEGFREFKRQGATA